MNPRRKPKKRFPDFNKMTRVEESEWWETQFDDPRDYDLEEVNEPIIFLPPPEKVVSLRLNGFILNELKKLARRKGMSGYSTLIRMWVYEHMMKEVPEAFAETS